MCKLSKMRKLSLLSVLAVAVIGALMGCGGGAKFTGTLGPNSNGNVVPQVTALSPASAVEGGPSFLLTVTGTSFVSGAVVVWNGNDLTTTYVSATELQAQVPASLIATPAGAGVGVLNPLTNGVESNSVVFTVSANAASVSGGATLATVTVQANDMVWDPVHQQIYLSVASSNGANGNTITVLDPTSGQLGSSQPAGSNPDKLAISSDSSYLYAGIDGSASVQRFTLPSLGTDINVPLGSSSSFGPYYAMDVETAPSSPHTIAVDLGCANDSPAGQGVVVYDDATARTNSVPAFPDGPIDSIQWNGNATQIYGANNETTRFDFYVMSVNSSGVQVAHDYPGVFSQFGADLHYDATTGEVYSDGGQVINPATATPVGNFNVNGIMVPDGALGYAYFLLQTPAQANTSNYTIEAFDINHFTPAGSIVVSNMAGTPIKLIRWGSNGLAILTQIIKNCQNSSHAGLCNSVEPGWDLYLISGVFVTSPASS